MNHLMNWNLLSLKISETEQTLVLLSILKNISWFKITLVFMSLIMCNIIMFHSNKLCSINLQNQYCVYTHRSFGGCIIQLEATHMVITSSSYLQVWRTIFWSMEDYCSQTFHDITSVTSHIVISISIYKDVPEYCLHAFKHNIDWFQLLVRQNIRSFMTPCTDWLLTHSPVTVMFWQRSLCTCSSVMISQIYWLVVLLIINLSHISGDDKRFKIIIEAKLKWKE